MNENTIFHDDPRLTAYALGELEGEDRAMVEAALRRDPALRSTVDAIRATAHSIETALASEARADKLTADGRRQTAEDAGWKSEPVVSTTTMDTAAEKSARRGKLLRFPSLYIVIGSLAAACFAVLVALHVPQPKVFSEQKHYVEVPLTPLPTTAGAEAPASTNPDLPTDSAAPKLADAADTIHSDAHLEVPAASERAVRPKSFNNEDYAQIRDNDFAAVAVEPLSTFGLDVDTASYANVRRFLERGERPPRDAVRIEELVNYFPYRYPPPASADVPFAASIEVAAAPWNPQHRLVRIGLKAREINEAARPAANLVFLVDVSGSMAQPAKLPLVQESLRLLVGRLRADDHVAIVTYAVQATLALPATPVAHAADILAAIDGLAARGSTNGAMGLQLAYDIAKANVVTGGVNRVILCTDGDFNVGVTQRGDLVRLIEDKAKSGVFLTVLGFGTRNLKDATLEQLADKGNGVYGYVDSAAEAKRLLVEQAGATLVTIAKDVKVQVEFNPAVAGAYRLIGYENRLLRKQDFADDRIDAGEVGAGHTVTALYEVVPVGATGDLILASTEPLKYQKPEVRQPGTRNAKPGTPVLEPGALSSELLTVKVRYKAPEGNVSQRLEFPLTDRGTTWAEASEDFKFAASVAGFGMILRESPYKGTATLASVAEWARQGLGSDVGGQRNEFLGLVSRAQTIMQ